MYHAAVTEFFNRRGEQDRFQLSSFRELLHATLVVWMTLHAALNLNQRRKRGSEGKIKCDLIAMWQNIHEALCQAKENLAPFGGINIVFAGDFAQLPPVGQRGLHCKVNTYTATTTKGQKAMFGKLLWLSISTIVLLKIVMRQTGDHNACFVEVLGRLHTVRPTWHLGEWLDACHHIHK
ncbi:hypothetical protein DFJ58DRAFT_846518 [Suillus subalutaceus]|uniref:uncharacterized protein n=1 Tax=Suillus subalutaceus TaxID=48586 RepID=UPI001B8798B6|nr:uncharacterized protein DFJ58DRAFT_846518 [Suillus subalutaceus]KAG1837382.1 hypothetical protein DFJ58DRAFT_846518 [Suillus subalutaceus]